MQDTRVERVPSEGIEEGRDLRLRQRSFVYAKKDKSNLEGTADGK